MSNYFKQTMNPKTGQLELAEWLDDHFGSYIYGVRFPSGEIFYEHEVTTYESTLDNERTET